MKNESSKILDEIGKKQCFTVPDDYFDNFSAQLMDKLPEVKLTPQEKPTPWVRVRPFIYMAAMFAGVWLMMNIFTLGDTSASQAEKAAKIAEGVRNNDSHADDLMNYGVMSDYDIMTYEDSVGMQQEADEQVKD